MILVILTITRISLKLSYKKRPKTQTEEGLVIEICTHHNLEKNKNKMGLSSAKLVAQLASPARDKNILKLFSTNFLAISAKLEKL